MNTTLRSVLAGIGLAFLLAGVAGAQTEQKAATAAKPAASAPSKDKAADKAADKGMAAGMVDLNSASEKELAALPKIGEVRAKAIIKGRPYKRKDELVEKKILSQDAYNEIKDSIIARQKPAEKAAAADKKK